MSSPQLSRATEQPNGDNNDNGMTATNITYSPDIAAAAAERRQHSRRPLAPSRSVRYTREPYLVSDNTAGGASVELGSDMTEITNVVTTAGTEADRASR